MAQNRVMVCVTRQKTCERLINYGACRAEDLGFSLAVVHAVGEAESFLGNPHEGEALEYLFSVSSEAGAELTLLKTNDAAQALADYAVRNSIRLIIMGQAPQQGESIITKLQKKLPNLEFKIVVSEEA